jgi:hypothetical protein
VRVVAAGPDNAEELPEASSDEAPALGIVGKKRKEHPQDSYGDLQGSTTPVQTELMRLGKRVHSLEDDLAVHKEYCTGIFEALFSSMKDKDLERCVLRMHRRMHFSDGPLASSFNWIQFPPGGGGGGLLAVSPGRFLVFCGKTVYHRACHRALCARSHEVQIVPGNIQPFWAGKSGWESPVV